MKQPLFKFSQEVVDTARSKMQFLLIEDEGIANMRFVASFPSYEDAVGFALDRVLSTKKCVHVYWTDAKRVAITVWPSNRCVEYGKEG